MAAYLRTIVCCQLLLSSLSKLLPTLVVTKVIKATKGTGYIGERRTRPFPNKYLQDIFTNPFLLCDEWGEATKELAKSAFDPGPPDDAGKLYEAWHEHRGFDILSVIKEGRGSHADSLGNTGVVKPGGIYWLRTGSGVEHAEEVGDEKVDVEEVAGHGFQIWINLPSNMKMNDPNYGIVQSENIPKIDHTGTLANGGLVKYLAGAYNNAASFPDRTDFTIMDVELPPNATESISIPIQYENVIVYAYRGKGKISGKYVPRQGVAVLALSADGVEVEVEVDATANVHVDKQTLEESHTFDKAARVELVAEIEGYAVMIFAAVPLTEPLIWRRDIIMNTESEIEQALTELRDGTFLKKRVDYNYRERALTHV